MGSFAGKSLARIINAQGDFLFGFSWAGTIELTGLVLGTVIAGIASFHRQRKT
jgi:hypothetical protein